MERMIVPEGTSYVMSVYEGKTLMTEIEGHLDSETLEWKFQIPGHWMQPQYSYVVEARFPVET